MAQHDYIIDNQTAPNFRSDLNNALAAIVSTNSGSSAPSTTYANMLWYDTTANILKMRNEADDAWINVGYLDQTANAFRILDDTQVSTTAGVQAGLLGDQSTATWEAGTGTTESLVSPAKVKAAIDNLVSTSLVLSATAGASYGGVGTYGLFYWSGAGQQSPSATVAGSSLSPASTWHTANEAGYYTGAGSPSGTWRLMGSTGWRNGTSALSRVDLYVSVFLRIS